MEYKKCLCKIDSPLIDYEKINGFEEDGIYYASTSSFIPSGERIYIPMINEFHERIEFNPNCEFYLKYKNYNVACNKFFSMERVCNACKHYILDKKMKDNIEHD